MRFIGTANYDANVTTMTNSLANALLTRPEISMNVVNLFERQFSAFSSYLSRTSRTKKGLYADITTKDFKVLGNRKFQWALKGYPLRKATVKETPAPAAGYTNLGEGGSYFSIVLDTDFFSPNDVLETGDGRTLLQVMNEYPISAGDNKWSYKVKLVTNDPVVQSAGVPATLVDIGSELSVSHTAFHEMSETGYEKNTYPEWHTNYMTIQRMQFSISGSAHNTVLWVEHNGQKLWMYEQEREMMRRWALARENQLLFGKATIDANDNVYMKDLLGRDIIQGDGLLAQGEGSLKFQYNTLTIRVLENIMKQMQLMTNGGEMTELFILAGQDFIWNFQRLMRDVFKYNPATLATGSGMNKGVDSNFDHYSIGGVKVTVAWHPPFDAQFRAQERDAFGVPKQSGRAIFISLGNTIGSDPMVELVTLGKRDFVKKTITGMSDPGNTSGGTASNSMDGHQVQILSETGICLRNPFGVAELYKP